MRPALVLLIVWTLAVSLLGIVGIDQQVLRMTSHLATQMLWFLGVYLMVIALACPMLQLHRRYGLKVLVVLNCQQERELCGI